MIDTHLHLFEYGFAGDGRAGADLADYQEYREKYGITRGVVVAYEGQESFAGNNSYVLGLSRTHAWIVPVVHLEVTDLTADPGRPGRWLAEGAAGWSAYILDRATALAWAELPDAMWASLDAPVIWSLNIDPDSLAVLTPRLAGLRQTTILLSHLGLPGRASETVAERLAPVVTAVGQLADCRVKVSGLYALAAEGERAPFAAAKPYLQGLREWVGIERLVWGSDFSPVLGSQDFASQVDLSGYGVFSVAELARLRADDLGLPGVNG